MALKDGLVKLKAFAAAPWFPVLVGLLSGANLFLLVMSAPLVILYCSAVLANPNRLLEVIGNIYIYIHIIYVCVCKYVCIIRYTHIYICIFKFIHVLSICTGL